MLVLTRKIDEQIIIGNDIKITLIRVRGNTVRLGIEAPRDVRIVRSELQLTGEPDAEDAAYLAELEDAFAHPRTKSVLAEPTKALTSGPKSQAPMSKSDSDHRPANRVSSAVNAKVYVGKVTRDGSQLELNRAPLASFISLS